MSKLKVDELDSRSGSTITVTAGKTLAGTDIISATQIAANAVTTGKILDDNVTYGKLQDTTTANRVLGAVATGTIGEVQVATDMVADNAVTLAKMAGLARGKIIVGDASGDPSALTVGAANQVLKSDGTDAAWAADSGGLFSAYAIICDQKAAGTNGGTFTQDAWQTRELNTELADASSIVTISSNQFTLGAGNYLVKWSAPAVQVDRHQTRFFDHTGAAALGTGTPENAETTMTGYPAEDNKISNRSIGMIRLTPSGSNVYSIEHYCTVTNATDGFGIAANFGRPETYTMVEIYKES